jgi:acetyl esterase/lipase/alkylation response protein AidB-like acyl-CoA dehydrogenase
MTSLTGVAPLLDLPARAKTVAALADQHAAASDRTGQLAQPVVDALHREGLFGMWVPSTVRGGVELDPVSSLQVIENLAYGDPSVGWVFMAAALAIGTGAAYLDDTAVAALFGGPALPVIAGQGTRPGTAVPKEGGFLLSGAWSFASGIKHATHIHTLGIIQTTGEPRIFVLPVEQATLVDNWDVLGLRGTGSIDYRIDNAFVPEAYTHFAVTDVPKRGGSLFRLGIIGFACIAHSAWALGIGRRLLDELAARARGGIGRTGSLAQSETFHEQYAKAEATYRGARALVYDTWHDIARTLDRGDGLSVDQHTAMRLAMANMTWSSHEVSEYVYTAAGTLALRAGTIQRLFRDMHAGTQHVTSSPMVYRNIGRRLAGLAENKTWVFLDLVDAPAPPVPGVDAATAGFLNVVRNAGGKPPAQMTPAEFRAQVRGSSALGAAAVDVHETRDTRIQVDDGWIRLRIYTPRPLAAGETLPIVVHYHGAGWVAGDLDTHDAIARYYARHADAIVVAVDYRLAPEHPFPAAVNDAYAALEWAAAQAREIHGDASRIAVTGDSAGGNLAAVVAQMARDRRGPRLAYQALLYPAVDLDGTAHANYPSCARFGGGDYFLSTEDMEWFTAQYLGADKPRLVKDPRVSPIAAQDLSGLPPALIVVAGCDPLRDEGLAYADRLEAAGVKVERKEYPGTVHAFVSFAAAIPTANETLAFVASRISAALRG